MIKRAITEELLAEIAGSSFFCRFVRVKRVYYEQTKIKRGEKK